METIIEKKATEIREDVNQANGTQVKELPRTDEGIHTHLDPETRIRMMTPKFSMREVDDRTPMVELRSDPGFHVKGATEEQPVLTRTDTVYNGICVNCAQRTICQMTHPENVIWHCEEYY